MTRSNHNDRRTISLGHPLVDDYLEFVRARARTNTWLAVSFDLKVFFSIVPKEPTEVTTADVFEFIKAQREPRHDGKVIRLDDREKGLAARTVKRRLCSVSGLFAYLASGSVARRRVPECSLAFGGLRRGEVLDLRLEDTWATHGSSTSTGARSKRSRTRSGGLDEGP